jgi:hypothetical protein
VERAEHGQVAFQASSLQLDEQEAAEAVSHGLWARPLAEIEQRLSAKLELTAVISM